MKTRDYQKAKKAVEQNWTTNRMQKSLSPEAQVIWRKLKARKERKEQTTPTTGQFCKNLVIKRLDDIAYNLPVSGYAMGEVAVVRVAGQKNLKGYCNRQQKYSGKYSGQEKYGRVELCVTPEELRHLYVIGGLVTYIPPQRAEVKKCYWYVAVGEKHHFKGLKKVDGYVYGGYHSRIKTIAKEYGQLTIDLEKERQKNQWIAAKKWSKALRCQYTYQDSIASGNCEAGTKAFVLRCGLDVTKKYRGQFLLNIAEKRSSSGLKHVERMIRYKANKL